MTEGKEPMEINMKADSALCQQSSSLTLVGVKLCCDANSHCE